MRAQAKERSLRKAQGNVRQRAKDVIGFVVAIALFVPVLGILTEEHI